MKGGGGEAKVAFFWGRRLPGGGLWWCTGQCTEVYWRKGRCTGPKSSVLEQISRVSGVLEPDPSTCSRSSTYDILNSSAACPNSRPEAQCVYWYATVRSGVYYWTYCMHLESLNQRDRRRADRRRRRHFLQGSTCIDIEQHCGQGCIDVYRSVSACTPAPA